MLGEWYCLILVLLLGSWSCGAVAGLGVPFVSYCCPLNTLIALDRVTSKTLLGAPLP